jgi:hypothetical protein
VVVRGVYYRSDGFSTLQRYRNLKEPPDEARRREEEESRREKEQLTVAAQKELAARFGKYGVKRLVSCSSLEVNPFAFDREVVAVPLVFHSMLERDKGLFAMGEILECKIVVSGIPPSIFSTRLMYVLMAGRVIGRTEVKSPLGPLSLPHLSFVGVEFCRKEKCAEFAPR